MKASLFAEDEEEKDMFQDYGATKLSSPRLIFPGSQCRPSGRKPFTMCLCFLFCPHTFQTFFWLSVQYCPEYSNCFFVAVTLFCLSAVGGLLQTRFTSGLLSQLSDSPNHSPVGQWPTKLTVQPPLSFMLPSHAPEPLIKTVGTRRLGGPVPIKQSVAQGMVGLYVLYRLHLWVNCQR